MEKNKSDTNRSSKTFSGIFKRWMILLSSIFLIAVVWTVVSYNGWKNYYDNDFGEIDRQCEQYLYSVGSEWSSDEDYWYESTCAPDNEYSDWSTKLIISAELGDNDKKSLAVAGWVLLIMFVSFLVRWLITGSIRNRD